jgi:hypothetical protein
VEARPSASADVDAALDRVEAAVAAGETDLGALGFWPIVAQVKRDDALIAADADRIGRIDAAAFRSWARLRAPVWAGTALLLAAFIAGAAAIVVAARIDDPVWAGILLIAAGAIWCVALHSPTHQLVGSLFGITFTDYFLGGLPPRPGLKIDYATYLRADPARRAWMHASGAIATKLAPFLALAFLPFTDAPWWAAVALLALGVAQIVTDLLFSVKSGDWKRFRREMAVAWERRAA